jgi:UDP-N-acetylmuramate dehydrogenase
MADFKFKTNENLKAHCTFQVGGNADLFYELENIEKLPASITFARKKRIPYLIIGKASNILFDDKGFRGLIIKNISNKIIFKKNLVTVDSGVSVSKLVQESFRRNLSPIEKWIGLPGTIGGAVYGNAGCNGLEIKDILDSAIIFNPKTGKSRKVSAKYFRFKYRSSKLKKSGEILLKGIFKLEKSKLSKNDRQKIMAESSKRRLYSQPLGLSSGSFFKNPSSKNPAGMLIEKTGLKGKTVGKAQISEKHANFLLNLGGATSEDIFKLAKLAKRLVKAKFAITLKPEVQILDQNGKRKTL